MREVIYRKSQGVERIKLHDSLKPTQRKLKSFMKESKEWQILWGNSEGASDRTVLDIKETEELNIFLSYILNPNEDFFSACMDKKILNFERVKDSIFRISKKCSTPGEIHLSVVWVFYYEYETAQSNAMPLFKIYRTTHSKEAFFLDLYLESYNGWDCYLNSPNLPHSLICVPREGNYVFGPDSESLDLSYLVVPTQRKIPELKVKVLPANEVFARFREIVVPRPLRQEISKVTLAVIDFIKKLTSSAAVFKNAVLRPKVKSLIQSIQDGRILKSDFLNKLSDLASKKPIIQLLDSVEVQNLFKSLKASQRDWDTIFETFVTFCESQAVHSLVAEVPYIPHVLRILGICVSIIRFIVKHIPESKEALPSTACDSSPLSHPIPLSVTTSNGTTLGERP